MRPRPADIAVHALGTTRPPQAGERGLTGHRQPRADRDVTTGLGHHDGLGAVLLEPRQRNERPVQQDGRFGGDGVENGLGWAARSGDRGDPSQGGLARGRPCGDGARSHQAPVRRGPRTVRSHRPSSDGQLGAEGGALAGRTPDHQDPPAASTRSSRPVSPVPRAGSAPPTPSSRISMTRVSPSRSTSRRTSRARECLTAFVKRLGDDEVGGGLDGGGEPWRRDVRVDRQGEVGDQRLQSDAQAAVGERRGQDAVDDVAEFAARPFDVGQCLLDEPRRRGPDLDHGARHLERDDGVHQPLLRAVVDVALQAPSGLVGGGDDARPRGGELRLRLGVGDRDGGQLGELGEADLDVGGERRPGVARASAPPAPGPRR